MIVGVFILAYLAVGFFAARSFYAHPEGLDKSSDWDGYDIMALLGIIIFWPMVLIAGFAYQIGKAAKVIITYDFSSRKAARKTRRIERELAKETSSASENRNRETQ